MAYTILIILRPWLAREQCRKLLVKLNKLLRIFASLELVLGMVLSISRSMNYSSGPTVSNKDKSPQPRKTYASFHATSIRLVITPKPSSLIRTRTKVVSITHTRVHTLTCFGGMRMTSVPSDKHAFMDRKLRRHALSNYTPSDAPQART